MEYLCPECRSPEIGKAVAYGQSSYFCYACGHFGPWRERIKIRNKEENR